MSKIIPCVVSNKIMELIYLEDNDSVSLTYDSIDGDIRTLVFSIENGKFKTINWELINEFNTNEKMAIDNLVWELGFTDILTMVRDLIYKKEVNDV